MSVGDEHPLQMGMPVYRVSVPVLKMDSALVLAGRMSRLWLLYCPTDEKIASCD